jgi:hypothetical protein
LLLDEELALAARLIVVGPAILANKMQLKRAAGC